MSPKSDDKSFKLTAGSLCCLASYVKGNITKDKKTLKKGKNQEKNIYKTPEKGVSQEGVDYRGKSTGNSFPENLALEGFI